MIYKGHCINDNIFTQRKVEKIESYSGDCNHEVSLTEKDLLSLVELIIEKEIQLKDSGIEFNNLHYEIGGKDRFIYNPEGVDDMGEYYCNLCWYEKEPEEQYNKRIAKEKRRIDKIIREEEEMKKKVVLPKNKYSKKQK